MIPRTAHVVIGANYGDEGKGHIVDYLTHQNRASCVVRFCGGAQAGHTVVRPEGQRHVFHHIGSGSFDHAVTYLGPEFICNPVLFNAEHAELAALGIAPRVLVDWRALVTTPFEVELNRAAEGLRGELRHGSCGIGINETVTRHARLPLTAGSLRATAAAGSHHLLSCLNQIRNEWVPLRAAALGVAAPVVPEGTLLRWIDEVYTFLDHATVSLPKAASNNQHYVFEGAQGLGLDQQMGAFPYVTRANTGLQNVIPLAKELRIKRLIVYYVTRTYATRHGAGPLAHEDYHCCAFVDDSTNIENDWQGSLRLAPLDYDEVLSRISRDLSRPELRSFEVSVGIAVTCADQLATGEMGYFRGGAYCHSYSIAFARSLAQDIGATQPILLSFGPTRYNFAIFPHDALVSSC